MKFFIGITPPSDTKEKIIAFQRSFPNNACPDLYEPHITVKAQAGLTENLDWIPRIESVAKTCKRFFLTFAGIGTFDETVVFLQPVASQELIELHRKLVEAINPDAEELNNYFELDRYNPHLSLGGKGWGLHREELMDMKKRGEIELAGIPGFEVTFLRIYRQILPNGPYEKLLDVSLNH
ncbi:MAG: 2'-5' RNA ligase family protein [Candidatus Komeilibacteria bacterium]